MMGGSPHLLRTLVQMDAPDHHKYRALTQAWFMPQNLKKLEDRIRVIARASVDKMAAKGGECDFVNEVALHFPLHVIMTILGVPESDEPRIIIAQVAGSGTPGGSTVVTVVCIVRRTQSLPVRLTPPEKSMVTMS
eukprot:gene39281-53101_t